MDSQDVSSKQQNMSLRSAFLRWLICLGLFIFLISLDSPSNEQGVGYGGLALLFYFGAGFYLSRSVLRRIIEWHPMYSTLHNVTSDKMRFFLFWPITYFFLFMRLGINKVL